ncbi:S-locus glycoprotein domain [Dillenia turbinata]|uniref:Receptor-like serine/threonine-protein kinase n=1 Tax=Dillenia turbinata TaxID=194707 RepID=A0AAN8ZMH7_9MAGN
MGLLFFLVLCLGLLQPSSSAYHLLSKGSSLSVEKSDDVLISPNGLFSAGFFSVGDNAYCFAIWINRGSNITVVWMANRDQPVNGRGSVLSLLKDGNLILTDAGQAVLWSTSTVSAAASVQLHLLSTGNLVLNTSDNTTLWESFDSPTDTLLPQQVLTRNTQLVSSRSKSNYSSGFYKLYFDNDNILRLLFNGPIVSGIYWPFPWLVSWEAGRSTYNDSRTAGFDTLGFFSSTDDLKFSTADAGAVLLRRLTLDFDGNLRMYSHMGAGVWMVSWQAMIDGCRIHGSCGINSLCSYNFSQGRMCSCLPGFKIKDLTDWAYGCEPNFEVSNNGSEVEFLQLLHTEFFGYDKGYYPDYTLEECRAECLQSSDCKGFQYKLEGRQCYCKTLLTNGRHSPDFKGDTYIKTRKAGVITYTNSLKDVYLNCSVKIPKQLERRYNKKHENKTLSSFLWFSCALGGVEFICICSVVVCLFRNRQQSGTAVQGYQLAGTRFRRFTYSELQKATGNFSDVIGRGAGGVVYKGVLSNNRVAVKRLNEANQGEAEFLAEVTTIGRLNHMNLIAMLGYCAEGKHRLLVYEYMEHGSLADNLSAHALDWEKRLCIAVGTARGLAYLHEECLEWVLHCDVKPQNILLDDNYQPKVADFGLSKLLNRGSMKDPSFSQIRGTRGYMAPEWVFNLPITSKVDVYSYGIVLLEMITGKSPKGISPDNSKEELEERSLVRWVRDKKNDEASANNCWIEDIVDPALDGHYDMGKMRILVEVAMQCVEEDKPARPTMRQVVQMLLQGENEF